MPDDPFSCPDGQLPGLDQQDPPPGATGHPDPRAAIAAVTGKAGRVDTRPFAAIDGAPVWVEADGETFLATEQPDGTWQATPATVIGCRAPGQG